MKNYARPHDRFLDLAAFLGVLALGGILVILGHVTAGSLAALCAALAGLYSVWQRSRASGDMPNSADTGDAKADHRPPARDAKAAEISEPIEPPND